RRYRQLSNPLSGRVKYSVGNRAGHPDNADFTNPLDAKFIDDLVFLRNKDDIDPADIEIYRHVIICKRARNKIPPARVENRLLRERHADSPDAAADDL